MRCRIFIKDASEGRSSVSRATVGQRIWIQRLAIGRRIGAQTYECNGIGQHGSAGYDQAARASVVRQMESTLRNDRSRRNGVSAVLTKRAASTGPQGRIQIQAGLPVPGVLIVNGEKPVALRADVTDLKKNIAGQFALNRKVVLRRVLCPQRRRKLSEQQNRTIERPVHRLATRRSEEAIRHVGLGRPVLPHKGSAEERVRNGVAYAEGRFGDKLLENQLFDWVVEESPPHADGGLVWTAGQLGKHSVFPARTPIQAETRCKCFGVSVDQSTGDALVTRNHQSRRESTRVGTIWRGSSRSLKLGKLRKSRNAYGRECAGINRRILPRIKPLNFLTDVCQRRIHLPPHTIVECDVRPNLPTVLCEEIERSASNQFLVAGALRIGRRQAQ